MLPFDIDAQGRVAPWDIGADEFNGTTAVQLQSFSAFPGDASAVLEWRTASELSNLGFHLYRGPSEDGPWTRLTTSLIPGLGSSATGQAYSFRDAGLLNGTRYFYRLEDVDASSKATSHGPVSAVPLAGASSARRAASLRAAARREAERRHRAVLPRLGAGGLRLHGSARLPRRSSCTRHGDPEAVSLERPLARLATGDARAADGRLLCAA